MSLTPKFVGFLLALLAPTLALAAPYAVYPGCSVPSSTPAAAPAGPPVTASGNTWWIDPVYGNTPAAGGLGTQAAPWSSIQGILQWYAPTGYPRPLLSSVPYFHYVNGVNVQVADQVGNPPVHPGDTIQLMSGNYGDVTVGSYRGPVNNSDWVRVVAAPGQTPVFDTLSLFNSSKWIFDGITVQSLNGTNGSENPLVKIFDQGINWPTTNIILNNLQVSTVPAAVGEKWTQAQWLTQARTGGIYVTGTRGPNQVGHPYTTCVAVTNSHMSYTTFGGAIMGDQLLWDSNEMDHFGDDGADYASNSIAITRNYIHDPVNTTSGAHMDGLQGYPGVYNNVLIDSNVVIRQTYNSPLPTYLQGIDAFDGDWTNMTVTNNAIITSSCWGLALWSLHNSLVADNTVVYDNHPQYLSGCGTTLAVGAVSHEGAMSSNTRVANNIAPMIWLWDEPTLSTGGMSADHNVAIGPIFTGQGITSEEDGRLGSGSDKFGNKIATDGVAEFEGFNPATFYFNLALSATAQAIGAGTSGAPLPILDIKGQTRTAPFVAGAYQ